MELRQAKRFLFFLLPAGVLLAQSYTLRVFGFPLAEAELSWPQPNTLEMTYHTVGLADFFWPQNNLYTTNFDTLNFGMRMFNKKIKQGDFKQKIKIHYANGNLQYDNQSFPRPEDTHTIFTLLARVVSETAEELDTRRFPTDHEGTLYEARFLWADTARIVRSSRDILCDQYRLDMIPTENKDPFYEETDTFMKYVGQEDLVRQIWVERSGKRRIIKLVMTVYGLPFEALINDE